MVFLSLPEVCSACGGPARVPLSRRTYPLRARAPSPSAMGTSYSTTGMAVFNGEMVVNEGKPVPAGFHTTTVCCFCFCWAGPRCVAPALFRPPCCVRPPFLVHAVTASPPQPHRLRARAPASYTGIPEGSLPVPAEEGEAIMARWKGLWKVTPMDSPTIVYTDATFFEDKVTLSGGVHNQIVAVANTPAVSKLYLFRAPDGTLFMDNLGTMVVSESPSELVYATAVRGARSLLTRVVAVQPIEMQREKSGFFGFAATGSLVDELAKLAKLKDSGATTEEEFSTTKAKLLSKA
ncbi:hypothetical protein T492DRAFT_840831 [Pavlovales sp. CCMP2436]|nr:hypothetical protein T492DRAFT_840831 [Pavlovales sp. CCMP2436]